MCGIAGPKAGFVLPIDGWARDELRSTMEDTLLDGELCTSLGLDPRAVAVADLWKAFLGHQSGVYWTRIWAVFVFLWCREQHMKVA